MKQYIKITDVGHAINVTIGKTYEIDDSGFFFDDVGDERCLESFSTIKYETVSKPTVDSSLRGDGGMVSYYAIPESVSELSDVIKHKNMNHSIGEAFCALYRLNDTGDKIRNLKKALLYIQKELDYEQSH